MSLSRTGHVLGSLGLLLVGSLAAMLVAERPISRGIGYDGHDCCHNCTLKVFDFFECFHTSTTGPCDSSLCIWDHLAYAGCESGAPQFGQSACNTTYDPNAVVLQQWKIAPKSIPQTCAADNGMVPVPNYNTGLCDFGRACNGKCFTGSCLDGTILESGAEQTGRNACS
jgi:hypothetical protein